VKATFSPVILSLAGLDENAATGLTTFIVIVSLPIQPKTSVTIKLNVPSPRVVF
jgi:hypothetical protein